MDGVNGNVLRSVVYDHLVTKTALPAAYQDPL